MSTPTDDIVLLSVPECAETLGMSRAWVWQRISRGELPSCKLGSSRRVPRSALREWIQRQIAESYEAITQ